MSSTIRILYDQYCNVINESNPDDRWDKDDVSWFTTINGLSKNINKNYSDYSPRSSYENMTIPFEVDDDKAYFLLYAIYSTGDSFHWEEGRTDFICLFETIEKAEEARTILKNASGYSANILLENETEFRYHIPWNGYFERLQSIEVQLVRVIE